MKLYAVENHYSLTGDSEKTKLFRTEKEAMAYLMQKFEQLADENGTVVESIGWDGDDVVSYSEARYAKKFYNETDEGIDHYRVVELEV